MRYQRCTSFDSGYCYNIGLRNGLNTPGCVVYDRCEAYETDKPLDRSDKTQTESEDKGRIDQIGQNGGTGEHYLVERVAKVLADDPQDWEIYIGVAVRLIGMIKDE